jgi:hypothetical protein
MIRRIVISSQSHPALAGCPEAYALSVNRFNGFGQAMKPLKRLAEIVCFVLTQLKLGVNERCSRIGFSN